MKISAEEIKKIALLSRLNIEDDQIEEVGKQLNDILAYMDLLNQVDITDVAPTAHAVSMRNVMRDDVPQPSLSNEKALSMRRNRKMVILKFLKSSRIEEEYCGSVNDTCTA